MKKILCILLTLSLVVCCLCAPAFAADCAHDGSVNYDWAGGRCSLCNAKIHDHTYVDSICTECNFVCTHFSDGVTPPTCGWCGHVFYDAALREYHYQVSDYNAETGLWKWGYDYIAGDYEIGSVVTDGTADGSFTSFYLILNGCVEYDIPMYLNGNRVDLDYIREGRPVPTEFDVFCIDDVWYTASADFEGYLPFDVLLNVYVPGFADDFPEFLNSALMFDNGLAVVDAAIMVFEEEGFIVNRVSADSPINSIGNTLESFLGMVSSAAHAVVTNPILLVSFSLSFLCFGIFIFRRIKW